MDKNHRTLLSSGSSMEVCDAMPCQDSYIDIPLRHLAPIVVEVLHRDLLPTAETGRILDAAFHSMCRKEPGVG